MGYAPLVIDHVNVSYKTFKNALVDANVELKDGEIFGLIGLNGAGKTTLIKVILDLIQASSGTVTCYGQNSKNIEARKNLSYLPEKFQPPHLLKGREFLDLAVSYYGKSLDMQEAEKLAESLHLRPEALQSRIGSYSKGMGQKIGLISSFLIDAPLYVLDEPMSGLDPKARIALKEQLSAKKRQGKTVFFSSHILSDIDEICDRIGVIHHGKILYVGTPAEFKVTYKDEHLEKAFLQAIESSGISEPSRKKKAA